jgi:hypothetical protein
MSLNCSCGWNFFLPSTTAGHEINCPSCGQAVRIPGRKPGQAVPLSAGDIALEINRKQARTKAIIIAAIVGVIVIAGGLAIFLKGDPAPTEEEIKQAEKDKLFGNISAGGSSKGKQAPAPLPPIDIPPPPPAPPPLYNSNQIQELKHNILANVWLANMASVISECMRFRNLTNDWAQLQADVAIYEGRIKHDLSELSKVGEKLGLETYLQQGDQIIGFAQRDFTTMKPGEAAAVLNTWVNNWRPGTALEQVLISRAGGKMTIYLEFPEDTKELLILVRHPSLQLEGAPGSGLVTEMVAIPAEVIQNVNTSFSALPPGYRSYLQPEERKKLEALTANKRGSSEDIEWLNHRILNEVIPAFQREAELIRSQVLALEPKLKENAATDVIIRKNGTKVEGQIVSQTETEVKIKTRFGAAAIPAAEIAKIEKGKGSATEFPQRYADAKGNLEKLVPLLAWCAEKNLKLEKEYVGYTVLTMDASNEKARSAVGLSRPSMGAVIQPATAPKYPSGTESAKVQGVEKTIEIVANDVISRNQAFTDVVVEMRRRTEGLTTTALPVAPAKSIKGAAKIQNPLTFDPARMPVPDAVEIGTWWSQMLPDERREFAKYYGLWCAFMRGRK